MTGEDNEQKTDAGWMADLALSVGFLTRLPISPPYDRPPSALAGAMRTFPLVGAAVGLAGGTVYALTSGIGLSPWLSALLAVAATILLTGALHEDAMADVADGFGGGRDIEAKLAIMRDSRIGAYGVLALILSVLVRSAALVAIAEPVEVVAVMAAAGAASRGVMPAVMHFLAAARGDGLAATSGKPDRQTVIWSLALSALVALALLGPGGAVAGLAMAAAGAAAMALAAHRQIGGYTGDVVGACGQMAEIGLLLAICGSL